MNKKIVLCILDGVGINNSLKGNAFLNADMPNFRYLWDNYPHTTLKASENAVGLTEGQMGNSEVGHLNIGAGRIIKQALLKINDSIKDGSFFHNLAFLTAIQNCQVKETNLHLIGMVSDGRIHSDINHLFALLDMCKQNNFYNVYIHVILDGRDTNEKAAKQYLDMLTNYIDQEKIGTIATLMGRYYIMNRDRNWDLTKMGYEAIVDGESEYQFSNVYEALESFYNQNLTDEFVKPTIIKKAPINLNDSIIAFNFRSDRMIQFTRAMYNPDFTEFERKRGYIKTVYVTMTEYEQEEYTKSIFVAFKDQMVHNTLGEVISKIGLKQKRITEYEKRLHITFYLNGMYKEPFPNEIDQIFERPDVFTYDECPEMKSKEITDEIIKSLKEECEVVLVNYPNGDAVGHTGIYEKAVIAMEEIDLCLGRLINETNMNEYILIITADHGNCECMYNQDGTPNKMHTTNNVPLIVCQKGLKLKKGALSNIAPTILDLLGYDCKNMIDSLITK